MSDHKPAMKNKSYGKFIFAATIYAVGVVAFCIWSYKSHQNILFQHVDHSLTEAAHTCQEILGTGRARQRILSGATNAPVYLQHQERLNRFVQECGFQALGVAAVNSNGTYFIISGKGLLKDSPNQAVNHGDPLPRDMERKVNKLANNNTKGIILDSWSDIGEDNHLKSATLFTPDTEESGFAYLAIQNVEYVTELLRNLAIRKTGEGFFLLMMVFPLIVLFNQTHKKTAAELEHLNTLLQQDVELQKSREKELKDAIHDLERFNSVSAGRESRIIELKAEVNDLLQQLNQNDRYNIDN
jgi:hypothetical protein